MGAAAAAPEAPAVGFSLTSAAATITGRSLSGVLSGDDVGLTGGSASFSDKHVGAGKTVTGTGFSLTGADAGNYSLASSTLATTASITAWTAQGYGFYAPVGVTNSVFVSSGGSAPMPVSTTTWNIAKGGSTIPLKFNVYANGVEKTSTSDISGFSVVGLTSCSGSATEDPIDFVTTGNTSLRYDTTAQQFIQNWKSPSVSQDSCFRATVTFADGSSLSAFFKLRK
jgi:hypothetical protein